MYEMKDFFEKSKKIGNIENELYKVHAVKNGLRNEDGTGVLVGLTKISDVVGYTYEASEKLDVHGKLYYRGIDVEALIDGYRERGVGLYEEVCFLILFGYLPNSNEYQRFTEQLHKKFKLPQDYLESKILRFPSKNLMNKLQQDVLTLYNYDPHADDISLHHVLEQGLHIVAKIPSIMCYNYQNKVHYFDHQSMYIHHIDENLTFAENILQMIRPDKKYTASEARVLDVALVLHADHGGGNNSTFVNVVMASTGTDIYSSFAGAIGSLKGPKHGGANLKVCEMMDAVIEKIGYTHDEQVIRDVVEALLDRNFFDHSGLIYGMGHAVYTLSDPRSQLLKREAKVLAQEKAMLKEFTFYELFEKVALEVMYERKGIRRCSNVDFYSGFVYQMLGIPRDLYTLLFVSARSVGWLAHTLESLMYSGKIIRPATKFVGELVEYIEIEKRGA